MTNLRYASLDSNVYTISLEKKIDYLIAGDYQNLVSDAKTHPFQIVELDFSKTTFVTLPGAMYLLSFAIFIKKVKEKQGKKIEFRISNYTDKVITALVNFGTINMLKTMCNLKTESHIDELNNKNISFWLAAKSYDGQLTNLYWPLTMIPGKFGEHSDRDTLRMFNDFIDYFFVLLDNELLTVTEEKMEFVRKYFLKSINEAVKNVWDHSNSWAVSGLHSNKTNKTTFCLFDFGIGFINSYIKRKGNYNRTYETDTEVLRWLFVEGNTSNDTDNYGHGLPIMCKFIDSTDGVLLIRTDQYLIEYKKNNKLKITDAKHYHPGAQVMINF